MREISFDSTLTEIESILKNYNWIDLDSESVEKIEKPGEGNMNVVMRVITNQRSLILKQSRPYVNKYQDIPAPLERIHTEYKFYNSLENHTVARQFPKIMGYKQSEYLLALEDLGQCVDMTYLYQKKQIRNEDLRALVQTARHLHDIIPTETFPLNLELRQLNHQHIFILPFQEDNGFHLDQIQKGLQELSFPFKKDAKLKKVIAEIGELYLSTGETLVHGDYYPGSWMISDQHIHILDPEFSFMGFKEFDIGVMAAHLVMSTIDQAMEQILAIYTGEVSIRLAQQITGIEIMRRLIGLAQLPLHLTLEEKKEMMELAYKYVME